MRWDGIEDMRLLLRLYDYRYDQTAMLYNNIPWSQEGAGCSIAICVHASKCIYTEK